MAAVGADCRHLSTRGVDADVRRGAGGERVGQSTRNSRRTQGRTWTIFSSKWARRFAFVWRRRAFPTKPEVGVDGAIGAEPEAALRVAGAVDVWGSCVRRATL